MPKSAKRFANKHNGNDDGSLHFEKVTFSVSIRLWVTINILLLLYMFYIYISPFHGGTDLPLNAPTHIPFFNSTYIANLKVLSHEKVK